MLEPLALEIIQLRKLDNTISSNNNHNNNSYDPNTGQTQNKLNYQLEKRNLSTVHLNAISRIYGDSGHEILELLRKNPAGTIPIILKRLKQKDLEWRKARNDLNKNVSFIDN